MTVRRSIVLSSADKFFATFARFATLVITARLLTPAEFGVAALGMAVLGVASVMREFGGVSYLIQVDDPTPARVQTAFTAQFAFALPLALICFALAGPAAEFYQTPGLRDFLWVTVACFMLGPFTGPIQALLSRRLAFGPLALIRITTTIINGATTITLAMAGFGFMSFAWATLLATAVGVAMHLLWHPKFPIYRINFHEWRTMFEFGALDSARNMMYYLLDNVPLLAFGRTLGAEAVGLFQRAMTLSAMPTTTLLSGLAPVVLPAFASHAREKRALGESYLQSISLITVMLWPATLWIAILAHPIVLVLLGQQWLEVVPLVQIIAAAYLIWFPVYVTNPLLIVAGGIRDTMKLALLTIPAMIAVQIGASFFGLMAVAWSQFVTIPIYVYCAVAAVKQRAPFSWAELGGVLGHSGVVALASAAAPTLVVILSGGPSAVSIPMGLVGGALGVVGWFVAVRLTRHRMYDEVLRIVSAGARATRRVRGGAQSDAPPQV